MANWIKRIFARAELEPHADADPIFALNGSADANRAAELKAQGDALLGANNFTEAEASYRRAIAVAPKLASAHAGLGFAQHAQGCRDAAISALSQALDIDPTIGEAHYLLATLARDMGKAEEAENGFRTALGVTPSLEAAYLDLCMLLVGQGRFEEAVAVISDGLAANPSSANLHFYLGNLQHGLSQLDSAAASFRTALLMNPNQPGALNNLGLVLSTQGKMTEAINIFQSLAEQNPKSADIQNNLGNAWQECGKYDEAQACFRRAIDIEPMFVKAYFNLGNAYLLQRKYGAAEEVFRAALTINPDHVQTQIRLGITLNKREQFDSAAEQFRVALKSEPDNKEALIELAEALQAQKKYDEALVCYNKVLVLDPQNADMHYNLGILLRIQSAANNSGDKADAIERAIKAYRDALLADSNHVRAHYNLGLLLQESGRSNEAIACFHQILSIDNNFYLAHHNLGAIYFLKAQSSFGARKVELLDKAVWHFESVLAINPQHVDSHTAIATSMAACKRNEEAMHHYDRALSIEPTSAKARTFRALLLLAQGDFSQGWKEYEYRLQSPDSRIEEFTQALWLNNAPLTAKSIILCAEQGIGDTIQFIRYVGKIRELNPKAIYLKVQAQLKTLLESLPGIAQVFDNDDLLPEADYYCPLASLPFAFKTDLSTIPGQIPYVSASSELRSNWKTELAHYQAPRIGLVWSGNRKFSNDAARSIPLQEFGTVLENNHVHFFSLQKEVRQDDQAYLSSQGNIIDLAPNLDDFSDTAAVIANLDLVITVDTAVAHLAGAMGKPVWILLPFAADFRWLIDRTDSPWYPTAKLFRQTEIGNWRHVLEDVVASLDAVFRLNDVTLQRERNA